MTEKPRKRKASFWSKPFDLNRNGEIDPAEAALIMMVIDDVHRENETHINVFKNNVLDIDDMDIEGI